MTTDPGSMAEIFQGGQVHTTYNPINYRGCKRVGEISKFFWHEAEYRFEVSFLWLVNKTDGEENWTEMSVADSISIQYGQMSTKLHYGEDGVIHLCDMESRTLTGIMPSRHKGIVPRPTTA